MYERKASYSIAVTTPDEDGFTVGFEWCREKLKDGDSITIWTPQRNNLGNSRLLEDLVLHKGIFHVTGRDGAFMKKNGSVLMAWADPTDIAALAEFEFNYDRIDALCIAPRYKECLGLWVNEAKPNFLGGTSAWDWPLVELHPVVVDEMKSLTRAINHNNTIASGDEKDRVVATLLALHDAGYELDGFLLATWTAAHGWCGNDPKLLEEYVEKINSGTRPCTQWTNRPGYVEALRSRRSEQPNN